MGLVYNIIIKNMEVPVPTKQEALDLPDGLSAIILPDLGGRNQFGNLEPIPVDEALRRLNSFLDSLNRQGVDIVSVVDLKVDMGFKPGVVNRISETKKVAIVRRIAK